MEPDILMAEVAERLRTLLARSRKFASALPATAQLVLRGERALAHAEDRDIRRPVQIALLGGTGVGKSQLFNALLNQPEASPTSHATRCYTARPVAAATKSEQALLAHLEQLGTRFVDVGLPGLVLVDTPDVDGALREHPETARKIVESSDAVVYVTCPDKRADLDVDQEVRSWAAQKRWFFVLNKLDREDPQDLAAIEAGFDQRLREIGFEPSDQIRFLVSAVRTETHDFHRLKEVLFSTRPVEAIRAMRMSNFFGYVQHALNEEMLAPIQVQAQSLGEEESRLNQRVRDVYGRVFASDLVQEQMRVVIREQTWRRLGERLGGPMYLAAWVRCRLGLIGASLSLGRAITRGGGGVSLVYMGVSSLISALRGMMPVWQIADAVERGCRKELENIADDARQVLQERGLGHLADDHKGEKEERDLEPPSPSGDSSAVGRTTAGLIRRFSEKILGRLPDKAVQEQVQQELDRIATASARRLSGPFSAFLANLPVWVMLGWVVYRIGMGWWQEKYLTGNFYLMAVSLILAAFLPGYLWMARRVRRATAQTPAGMLDLLSEPSATQPLRSVRRRLEELGHEAAQLRRQVERTRVLVEEELQPGVFGVRPAKLPSH